MFTSSTSEIALAELPLLLLLAVAVALMSTSEWKPANAIGEQRILSTPINHEKNK